MPFTKIGKTGGKQIRQIAVALRVLFWLILSCLLSIFICTITHERLDLVIHLGVIGIEILIFVLFYLRTPLHSYDRGPQEALVCVDYIDRYLPCKKLRLLKNLHIVYFKNSSDKTIILTKITLFMKNTLFAKTRYF